MAIQYYSQEQTLDLLVMFDKLCKRNGLRYSLGFETLYGAHKLGGFLPSNSMADVLMPYEDYNKFLEISNCEIKFPYYIQNYKTFSATCFCGTQLKKRSKVRLPLERKGDETYYDYNIDIYPVVPIANGDTEYFKVIENYIHHKAVVEASTTGTSLRYGKSKYYRKTVVPLLSEDKKSSFQELVKIVESGMGKADYIIIPIETKEGEPKRGNNIYKQNSGQTNGCIKKMDTYTKYTELEFEGYRFSVIEEYEQWLKDYYGENYYSNEMQERKGNLILLRGHEERRRMQLVQLDLLLEVSRICKKYNISFAIISGTLLGAVRHQGFIPWDYDADIAFLKEEYDKFIKIAPKEMDSEKYYLSYNGEEIKIHNVYARMGRKGTNYAVHEQRLNPDKEGISIDIFPLYNGADTYMGNRIQTWLCNYLFKPMAWAHNRGKDLPLTFKNLYYKIVRFVPLSWSYKMYMYFATMFEKKDTDKCSWLIRVSNPFNTPLTQKKTYTELKEIEFENNLFPCPINSHDLLVDTYGEEYMRLPGIKKRCSSSSFQHMDTGTIEIDITSGLGEEIMDKAGEKAGKE